MGDVRGHRRAQEVPAKEVLDDKSRHRTLPERWERYGGTAAWPEFEVFPTTAWNYGLVLDEKHPARSFQLTKKPGPLPDQPFTTETSPLQLKAHAKKIPDWKPDSQGMVGKLPASPVKSDQPIETVTLIPMGAARLRISSFPMVSVSSGGQ